MSNIANVNSRNYSFSTTAGAKSMRLLRAKRRLESLAEKRVAWLASMETRRHEQECDPNDNADVVAEYKCLHCSHNWPLNQFDELKLCCKTCNGTVDRYFPAPSYS